MKQVNETKTHVNVLGEELDIVFNMQVEILYEEITNDEFDINKMSRHKNAVALYMAAIMVANPDTKITIGRLCSEATADEITALNNATIYSMIQWMNIPTVVAKKNEQAEEEKSAGEGSTSDNEEKEEETPKN